MLQVLYDVLCAIRYERGFWFNKQVYTKRAHKGFKIQKTGTAQVRT